MVKPIPMVDTIPIVNPIPMADSIPIVDPIPMVEFRFWHLAISVDTAQGNCLLLFLPAAKPAGLWAL